MTSGIGDQYLCRVCLLISAKFGPGFCYHHHQPSPTGALLENKNCRRLKLNWKCMCGVDTIYCPAAHILFSYSGSGQKYSWRLQMASQKPRWTKEGLKRIKSSSLGDGPPGGWWVSLTPGHNLICVHMMHVYCKHKMVNSCPEQSGSASRRW